MKRRFFILFFLLNSISVDCRIVNSKQVPSTGGRHKELPASQNIIGYFAQRNDTLGVRSALFLLSAMDGLGCVDPNSGDFKEDISSVSGGYLIRSIQASLDASRDDLILKRISENTFLEYVLPHRLAFERLTNWKSACRIRYEDLIKKTNRYPFKDRALYSIAQINKELIGTFKYNSKDEDASFLTWEELIKKRQGGCWAMTNTIAFPLRAMGIPVGTDFITGWANANGTSHAWNVFIENDGKAIPFLGFEASPPHYNPFQIYKRLNRYPAKVFRKTYSRNARALKNYVKSYRDIPMHLDFDRFLDVSNQYMETKSVKINCANFKSGNILYLSLFSKGTLNPVFWTKGADGVFIFDKMGVNGLYSLADFSNEKCSAISYPFSINEGRPHIFKPNKKRRVRIVVSSICSLETAALSLYGQDITRENFFHRMEKVYTGKDQIQPKNNEIYKMYYWDKGWIFAQSAKKTQATNLTFDNMPSNSVYMLVSRNDKISGRVFTYANSVQKWW